MKRFEDFYDIRFGEPSEGLPSFSYVRVDAYARIYDREYGTIVPRDVDSVSSYDVVILNELLGEYIQEATDEYRIVDINVIMKPRETFNEKALLDFFNGKLSFLCIRAGLAVGNEGQVITVCGSMPVDKLSEWDCELISDLNSGRCADDPQGALLLFKERYPSLMVGYEAPTISEEPPKPVRSFKEQANEQVREVINYFHQQPYSEIHHEQRLSTYHFYNGARIVVSNTCVTVHNCIGERALRYKLDSTKQLVINLLRNMKKPVEGRVGERMFRAMAQRLASRTHDIEIEGDVLIAFKLDNKISVRYEDHSITADFTIGPKRVTATMHYASDVDDFTSYLEDMCTATKVSKWQPE